MRIATVSLNDTAANSQSMLSLMEEPLSETLLKSIKVCVIFNGSLMRYSEKYDMQFHPMPGQEFQKLRKCYEKAIRAAAQFYKATELELSHINIVYVDCENNETEVTLTPAGIIVDLTHLTLSDDEI